MSINSNPMQIFSNGKWNEYSPYIYHNKEWKEAIPYLYHNGNWINFPSVNFPFYLLDDGYIDGILWNKDHFDPIKDYSSTNQYEYATNPDIIDSNGNRQINTITYEDSEKNKISRNVISAYSSRGNVAVNWSTPIKIPKQATAIKFYLGYYYYGGSNNPRSRPHYQVGFLRKDASHMQDTQKGYGVLTEEKELNFNNGANYCFGTISLKIDEELRGQKDYRVVINYIGNTSGLRNDFYINKVWFE